MSKTKAILFSAVAGMGLTASAHAATITTTIQLLNTSNVELPKVGGVYQIPAGSTFRVQVNEALTSPNQSDGSHVDANTGDPLAPIPLGIQNLTFDLRTPATNNLVTAIGKTGTSPSQWGLTAALNATKQAFPSAANYSFTNLNDTDVDGDLDPNGAGFSNNALVYDNADAQQGPGLSNGLGANTNVIRGAYTASNVATDTPGTFSVFTTTAKVFSDPTTGDSQALASVNADSVVNTPVSFVVTAVPEPASLSLLGLGAVGLLARRRRTA